MKTYLPLLLLLSTTLCSQHFLRILEDDIVTEDKCKSQGKKYQTKIEYQCKTGNSVFRVEKEADCKKGTWTKNEVCSAPEIPVEQCSGKPTFTTAVAAIEPKCELNGQLILGITKQEECVKKLVWMKGDCSFGQATDETACKNTIGEWTPTGDEAGTCSEKDGTMTRDECEEIHGVFTPNTDSIGTCSFGTATKKNECETSAKWSATDDSLGKCTTTESNKKESECTGGAKWEKTDDSLGKCTTTESNKKESECTDGKTWEKTDDSLGNCKTTTGTNKKKSECTSGTNWEKDDNTLGTCTDGSTTTKSKCEGTVGKWSAKAESQGTCSFGGKTTKAECENTKAIFESTSETTGTCTAYGKTPKSVCIATKGVWTPGEEHCSVKGVSYDLCQGETEPSFTPGEDGSPATCKLGDIVIAGRTNQTACIEELKKLDNGTCSNKEVLKKEDCESEPGKPEAVTVGECVENSGSKYLKAISLSLLLVSLIL